MAKTPARINEADLLAGFAIVLVALVAYLARNTLNPDGVSYLDLANVLRQGDWAHFVQGYWSPLYPILIAVANAVAGMPGGAQPGLAHAINGLAAAGTAVIIWRWARVRATTFFTRASFAALLIASAGLPSVEPVTPDVLLLFVITWIGYELLVHGGRRWLLTGVLLGLAFLTKTSVWPWLAVALIVRLWGAREARAERAVWLSTAVAVVVMSVWVVPMSRKERAFTLSTSGQLNYCWYLENCDSRTPDTHGGAHRNYHDITISDSLHLAWAEFDNTMEWTYEPWSDPTAWAHGLETQLISHPSLRQLGRGWLENMRLTFGLWLLPLLLGVLVPMVWLERRPGMWRELGAGSRDPAVVMILGLAGLGQFIAVHVEPRLIGPFGLLLALGALSWLCSPQPGDTRTPAVTGEEPRSQALLARHVIASIGLLGAGYFAVWRMKDAITNERFNQTVVRDLAAADAKFTAQGLSERRIVIFGQAIPLVASAYRLGGHIVAQMLPRSSQTFSGLSAPEQSRLVDSLFSGKADVVWVHHPDGTMGIVPLVVPTR